jgi:hypothetical protein
MLYSARSKPHFRHVISSRCLRVLGLLGAACAGLTNAAWAEDAVAISSKTSNDYSRTRLADGTFSPEYYSFGKGGVLAGQAQDPAIEKMDFMDIARTIAIPLEHAAYLPSKDPKATKLLIMVYVGRTGLAGNASDSTGYTNLNDAQSNLDAVNAAKGGDSGGGAGSVLINPGSANSSSANDEVTTAMGMVKMENNLRQKQDMQTVSLLGYDSWWEQTQRDEGTPFQGGREDLVREVEEGRYFVVLMAYDFQLMWKEKKPKLLWEARFSIREQGNFGRQLAGMTEAASKYFGRNSDGLLHRDVPAGEVEIGTVKSLGTEPAK